MQALKEERVLQDQVKSLSIFEDWGEALLEDFLMGAEVNSFPPHFLLSDPGDPLPLSILIDGLLGVSFERDYPDNLDNFIFKGQLLDEMEFLHGIRKGRFVTLTRTSVIIPRSETVAKFHEQRPDLLYRALGISLAAKMAQKNEMFRLYQRKSVRSRIRFLLTGFDGSEAWSSLFVSSGKSRNSYEINALWSDLNLMSLLSTEFRTIKRELASLVKENIISVELFEKHLGSIRKSKTLSSAYLQGSDCAVRKNTYIKIRVLNRSELKYSTF